MTTPDRRGGTGPGLPSWVIAPEGVLVLAALLLAPLAVLAPLLVGASVLLLAVGWRRIPWRRLDRMVLVGLAALVLWAVLSSRWSPQPGPSLRGALQLGGTLILGGLYFVFAQDLDRQGRRRVGLAFLADMGIALLALGFLVLRARFVTTSDYTLHQALAHFSRGAIVVTASVVPLAAVLFVRAGAKAVLAAVATVAVAIMLGSSGAAKMGLLALLAIAVAARVLPRAAAWVLAAALVATVIATPLLAARLPSPQRIADQWPSLSNSTHHRMTIWSFTGRNIAKKPMVGWGFDGSRSIPGADDEIRVVLHMESQDLPVTEPQLPLHPHNNMLQWWLELGLIGVAIITVVLLVALRRAATIPSRMGRSLLLAFAGTAFMVAQTSFGAWQVWWLAGLWMLAGLSAAFVRDLPAGEC
ncbi:O-antigen ligase family protein [Magnetospirillum sp. 15-1]|uniref:O-antigen ligase family protein n=1 Tax=Magnetospirillum sp. 15-1 TaxID=1979370 RepID=UPI000BBC7AF6|nr:O-antigen ligase family protein [Magnetospirillum sp. 15-1]